MFNVAFFFLGASAALFGTWVERAGPRKAMLAAAVCFSGGFFVSALAVELKALLLLYAGYGVLGGIGLGLGYIAPVSTLIKWFPDRPGMATATGLAIMGFGGGAMLGSPLAVNLMERTTVASTFFIMGAVYLALMLFGAAVVRLPASAAASSGAPTADGISAADAIRSREFWLVWLVLFTNVTAGIGILGQASPMIQEMFAKSPQAAAGFVCNALVPPPRTFGAALASGRATPQRIESGPAPVARLLVYWAVVAVPLLWGISQVVEKSIALFRGSVPPR